MLSTFHYLLYGVVLCYCNLFFDKTVDNKSRYDLVSQAIAILKLVLKLIIKNYQQYLNELGIILTLWNPKSYKLQINTYSVVAFHMTHVS